MTAAAAAAAIVHAHARKFDRIFVHGCVRACVPAQNKKQLTTPPSRKTSIFFFFISTVFTLQTHCKSARPKRLENAVNRRLHARADETKYLFLFLSLLSVSTTMTSQARCVTRCCSLVRLRTRLCYYYYYYYFSSSPPRRAVQPCSDGPYRPATRPVPRNSSIIIFIYIFPLFILVQFLLLSSLLMLLLLRRSYFIVKAYGCTHAKTHARTHK